MNVGEIIIKVKADNKDLDKQLKAMESAVKEAQKELEKLEEVKSNLSDKKIKIGIEIDKREEEIEKQLESYYEIARNKGKYNVETVSNAERIIQETHEEDTVLQELNSEYDEVNEQIKQNEKEQENFKEQIVSTKQKAEEVKNAISMKDRIEEVNKSLSKTIKHIVRWGLAIFGIQGAFNFIRSSMSTISQYDEQLASDIQYIRTAIAFTVEPIVRAIVNLMKELLYLVGTIAKTFGWDIFKGANKGLEKAVGYAKELRKQLAPFDEMNILSDNSSGGGGGTIGPSFDLTNIPERKWMKDLADIIKKLSEHWRELLIVVGSFGSALLAIKFSKFIAKMVGIEDVTNKVKAGFALTSAGIALLVGSITNLIINWDKLSDSQKVLNVELAILGAGFIALGVEIQTGMSIATMGITALITAIGLMITDIGRQIVAQDKEIRSARNLKKQTEELTKAKERQKQAYDDLIDAVDRQTEAQKNLIEVEGRTKLSGEELYNKVEQGILTYKDMNEQQRETYKAYKELIEANEGLVKAEEEKIKSDSKSIASEHNVQIATDETKTKFDELKETILKDWEEGKIKTEDATDSISRMMGQMGNDARKTFVEDLPDAIKEGLDPGKYRTTLEKLGDIFAYELNKIKKALEIEIQIGLTASSGGGFSGSGRHGAKGLILDVPRLAMGGIVSMPGRGVPIGNAIIGERGREAVLPLTDTQQMAMLGEAIGRYITINAQMNNYMNGRLISRELQRVQNGEDFAFNR